jgi:hypothetical protein
LAFHGRLGCGHRKDIDLTPGFAGVEFCVELNISIVLIRGTFITVRGSNQIHRNTAASLKTNARIELFPIRRGRPARVRRRRVLYCGFFARVEAAPLAAAVSLQWRGGPAMSRRRERTPHQIQG